jgi:hypothetical protein
MIDETVLERLLREEADTYEPPAGGPERILSDAATAAPRGSRVRWLVAAAAVLVVVAVGVPLARDNGTLPAAGRGSTGGSTVVRDESALKGPHPTTLPSAVPAPLSPVTGGSGTGAGSDTDSGSGRAPVVDSAHVIRTGEVWVEVPKARVPDTLRAAARIATVYGGYVSESSTESAGDSPTGTVVIRMPVARFDRAVEDASRLGEVREAGTKGEDVTDQVVDTAARLKTLVATRAQLQTLLARARTVGEVLSVQSRITDVQTQIEQLEARKASLANRTTYGTLSITVSPEGTIEKLEEERTGFSKAWHDAVESFVGGFEGLVAASGQLAFLLVVGSVLFFLLRKAYRVWIRGVV